jgi:diadenosine tetraphosphatase ApaH/serine/threonine PP2A family protein phosphatase
MLVVTANWNITDGTLWRRPLQGLAARAWGTIQRAGLRAGFRQDGHYEPIDRLDIVFAGDTCDLLSSRCWIERDLRPWNRSTRVAALC